MNTNKKTSKKELLISSFPFLKKEEELDPKEILQKGKNPKKVPLSPIEEALLESEKAS